MRNEPAEPEVYDYQRHLKFQTAPLLVLAVGLALIVANQLFSLAFWVGMAGAFLATGVLIAMRSGHWPTIQPQKTITIDSERQIVTFEGFRLKRHDKSLRTGRQNLPRLAVRFEDVHDVYYHSHRHRSGGAGTLVHLDRDAVNRYFARSGDSNRRGVTLEVVFAEGSVRISMHGLNRSSELAERLSDIASNSLPAELKNSPVYTRELTLGIGLIVAFAILLAISWDLKEVWWIWMLLLAGGLYRLFLAVHEKRRHQVN